MPKADLNANATTIKLSDLQRSLLTTAAQQDNRCLIRPRTLRGAQAAKLSETLIAVGYVREVKAKGTSPAWREDGNSGAAFALKLTAAGAKAIAAESTPAVAIVATAGATGCNAVSMAEEAPLLDSTVGRRADAQLSCAPASAKAKPRAISKIAAVIALLSRPEGATLLELIATTDWLPHTTRAALTGLRKRGYALTLDRGDRQRGSVYRIIAQPNRVTQATTERASEAA